MWGASWACFADRVLGSRGGWNGENLAIHEASRARVYQNNRGAGRLRTGRGCGDTFSHQFGIASRGKFVRTRERKSESLPQKIIFADVSRSPNGEHDIERWPLQGRYDRCEPLTNRTNDEGSSMSILSACLQGLLGYLHWVFCAKAVHVGRSGVADELVITFLSSVVSADKSSRCTSVSAA